MKRYIYFIFLVALIFPQDVHIWISEIEDNHLELSIKSNQDIYGFDFEKQIEWCKLKLNKTDYFMPKVWLSVFGPIFMCKKIVMKKLYKKKFNKILPTNKLEQMCMERLFGIAFQQEGYDASNSVQGEHFTTPLETLNFQKNFFKRK